MLEAGQLANDDLSICYQPSKVATHRCERYAYLVGDLQIEPLPMFFQALQNFHHP